MKKIVVIFANGTEEIEALTPVDVLRRAGAECDIISISGKNPTGSHGIMVVADKVIEQVDLASYDGIVIPGGMPGATNISCNDMVLDGIAKAKRNKKLVAAICASPAVVLADNGLLDCEKATCYKSSDFVKSLGDKYTGKSVERCGNFITADGPKSAMEFSLAICEYFGLNPKF